MVRRHALIAVFISLSVALLRENAGAQPQTDAVSKLENLGPGINTAAEELSPVISPDGKTIYFVREGTNENIGGMQDQDVWMSTLGEDGIWQKAVHLPPPINDSGYNICASISTDGNTLLLLNVYYKSGAKSAGFSLSHRTSSGWTFPEELKIPEYYNNSTQTSGMMSSDQKTLIMSVRRNDSRGERDLYFSRLGSDGTWSVPVNLGDSINTAANEATPFLAADNTTLYFSSDGWGGYGDRDIFVSRRLDDTWQHWSTPLNLGPTINTPGWDGYYTVPSSGDYAYLVTSEGGYGKEDICRVPIPKALRPSAVVLVSGRVLDTKTHQPVAASITYSLLSDANELGVARSDSTSGHYEIVLPSGKKYAFHASAQGYYPISERFDASKLGKYQEVDRDLMLAPIEAHSTIRLNNIFFETGKATLQPDSYPELLRVAQFLVQNPTMKIEIDGYTDDVGSDQSNMKLSRARAEAVKAYIATQSIEPKRMLVQGFGKSKPLADNSSDEGKQQNRRVEFTILEK